MKVILLDNVDGVGKKGETQDVRDGFGRNFLVPRGLAMPATSGNVKKLEEQAKVMIKRNERNVKSAEAVKERLEASHFDDQEEGWSRRQALRFRHPHGDSRDDQESA